MKLSESEVSINFAGVKSLLPESRLSQAMEGIHAYSK